MAYDPIYPVMFYDETCQVKLLDENGDLASATIASGSRALQMTYVETNDATWTQACLDSVLDNYVQALNMNLFLKAALVGWGDQSEEIFPTLIGDGEWVEPGYNSLLA